MEDVDLLVEDVDLLMSLHLGKRTDGVKSDGRPSLALGPRSHLGTELAMKGLKYVFEVRQFYSHCSLLTLGSLRLIKLIKTAAVLRPLTS